MPYLPTKEDLLEMDAVERIAAQKELCAKINAILTTAILAVQALPDPPLEVWPARGFDQASMIETLDDMRARQTEKEMVMASEIQDLAHSMGMTP
jgi:hypothetical protein